LADAGDKYNKDLSIFCRSSHLFDISFSKAIGIHNSSLCVLKKLCHHDCNTLMSSNLLCAIETLSIIAFSSGVNSSRKRVNASYFISCFVLLKLNVWPTEAQVPNATISQFSILNR